MKVSIIIPCFNEVEFIRQCVASIDLSCKEYGEKYEIIIADGGSDDGTLELLTELSSNYEFLNVINNPNKLQVYALNQMISVLTGEYVIRCDAHAIYGVNYVSDLVGFLVDNPDVGNAGTQVITKSVKKGLVADSISVCLGSRFGVGGSHRSIFFSEIIDCDTVLFGAWNRRIFEEVGLFDVNFIRGQDLEHNIRIARKGYRVVQLPIEGVTYFSRNNYKKLFNMMKQYASVKPMLFKKGYGFPNYRSLIPFLMYAFFLVFSFISPQIAIAVFSLYLLFAFSFSFYESCRVSKIYLVANIFVGYLLQHIGHAFGMTLGLLAILFNSRINWQHTR